MSVTVLALACVLKGAHPLDVAVGDGLDRVLARRLVVAQRDQRVPERGTADGEADEPRHRRRRAAYTDPEVAQVGLTPRQAREEDIAINEYRLELAKVERAFIDGEEEGFAAIYTRRGNSEIVGATLVAAHAGEMISELTLAMTHKVPLEVLAETVHCYPTQAEVVQRVALLYANSRKTATAA